MDYATIFLGTYIAGVIVAITGIVKLITRNRTNFWSQGGAEFIAGLIVAGIAIGLMFFIVGRALILNN